MARRFGPVGLWSYQLDLLAWAEAKDVVAEIDDLGYGAMWIPEAVTRHPFVAASLILAASNTLGVGTGIASIHARSPLATKAAWWALDEAYPDRFVLGLGVSHAAITGGLWQREYSQPLTAMRTYLEAVDAAPYAAVPPQHTPRRVIAALGPKMLALATELADGVHPYNVTAEHTAMARDTIGPDRFLAPEMKAVLETDPARARQIGRENLAVYLGLPNYTNNLRRLGFDDDDFAAGGSDRLVDALVAWGDEEAIAARVRGHRDAGADHVAVQVLTKSGEAVPLDDWRRLAPALIER